MLRKVIQALVSPVRKIAERNYSLAKAIYIASLKRQLDKSNVTPVLLYQMGKVGSKTIRLSLREYGFKGPIYHSHLLTEDRIRETEEQRKKYFRTDRHGYLTRPWMNRFLRDSVDGKYGSHRWKLITLTREPISRNISAFFENCVITPLEDGEGYRIVSDYYDLDITISDKDYEKLMNAFMEKLNHDSPLDFFDKEIKAVLGVDIYAEQFDKEKGYEIFEKDNYDVLVIKLEKLKECASEAFKEFMGLDGFTLVDTNVGSEKDYAALYKDFRVNAIIPQSYVDHLYNSKYMNAFYTEEEKSKFLERWKIE